MTDIFSLQGKVALVTGASSGLGAHFAKVLADAGAQVVLGARRLDRIEILANEINSGGGEALAVAMDVTDRSACERVITQAEQTFGPVTILVNNAGVTGAGPFTRTTEEAWDMVMDLNMKAVWQLSRLVVDRLLELDLGGSIVNLSSVMGIMGTTNHSLYCASKAGVAHLTKAMALELYGKGIRVNALCPGLFPSEMTGDFLATDFAKESIARTPANRVGRHEELSGPLLLLASDASSFMSGVLMPVDAGHSVQLA